MAAKKKSGTSKPKRKNAMGGRSQRNGKKTARG